MADFVRADKLEQAAHQIVRQRQLLRTRVERPYLQKVPIALQVHDVVVELDVRVEDFACARVRDTRPHGVLDGGGQPADDRVAHVLRAEFRILLRGGSRFADNGVLEAGRFEGSFPALHARVHVRNPLGRRRRIDVIHDRLHRFGKRRSRILLLQAPARDVESAWERAVRRGRNPSAAR